MGRKKLLKLNELELLPNVFSIKQNIYDELNSYFGNKNPLVLEVGCGEGDYTTFLAEQDKTKNYLGIDLAGQRIWAGAKKAIKSQLSNAAFIHGNLLYLKQFLPEKSISEIWIPFPGPQRKAKFENRILLSTQFLEIYKYLLVDSAIINVKTDSEKLLEFTLTTIAEFDTTIIEICENLYACDETDSPKFHKTKFEKSHLSDGRIIKYLSFRFN